MSAWEDRPTDAGRWPRRGPWASLLVLAGALAVAIGGSLYMTSDVLTPLQRYYLFSYVRSTAFASQPWVPASRYLVLDVPDRTGWRLATETDLDRRDLVKSRTRHDNAAMREDLRRAIYDDATLGDIVIAVTWYPLIGAAVFLVCGLFVAIRKDITRSRANRQGMRLRGREKVDADEFNRRTAGDGLTIRLGSGVLRK